MWKKALWVLVSGMWWKGDFFALDLDPDHLLFYNFLQYFVLLIGCLGIGPLSVLSLSHPDWGNSI